MTPAMWFGFCLVALVLLAGGAEIYTDRRRRGELRARFKREYSGQLRSHDRVRRAEAVLSTRMERFERAGGAVGSRSAPMVVPVVAARDEHWRVGRAPFVAESLSVLEAD